MKGDGKSHGATAGESVIESFKAVDQVDDFPPGIRAAGGGTKVRAAAEGASVVNQALAGRGMEKRTGPVGALWKALATGSAQGAGSDEGFTFGQKGCPAGQAKMAALRAPGALPLNGPVSQFAVDFPDSFLGLRRRGCFCGTFQWKTAIATFKRNFGKSTR